MRHLDEARRNSIDAIRSILSTAPEGTRAVLVVDLFGDVRVVLWAEANHRTELKSNLERALAEAGGSYWTGDIWEADGPKEPDQMVYERAWEEGRDEVPGKLRVLDRHRNRGAWLEPLAGPPWESPSPAEPERPPIIVFYSFKGGVGRSTALAAFAIQRARQGERVAVIDADLDAPGVGSLLDPEGNAATTRWGVVDYLLERPRGEVDFRDYYRPCGRAAVTGAGEILVVAAGRLDGDYLGKLARVDTEPVPAAEGPPPFLLLLEDVRSQLKPHWILLDARAGLAEPAGMLLAGVAHLHLFFGTFSEQSWQGLRLVIERLGAERVRAELPQASCLMVQAMVPEDRQAGERTMATFAERSLDEFLSHYYAEDPEPEEASEGVWYVGEATDSSEAPHVPVKITYNLRLADFRGIDDVADELAELPDYQRLAERIAAHFGAS